MFIHSYEAADTCARDVGGVTVYPPRWWLMVYLSTPRVPFGSSRVQWKDRGTQGGEWYAVRDAS